MLTELLSIAKNIASKTVEGTKDAALSSFKSAVASEHQNFERLGVNAVRGVGQWMRNLDTNTTGLDDAAGIFVEGLANSLDRNTLAGPPKP